MATTQTTSTLASALKTIYSKRGVEDLVLPKNKLLALVKKSEDFKDKNFVFPAKVEDVAGGNYAIDRAIADAVNSTVKDFTVTRTKDYQTANLSNELIEATAGNAESFVNALKFEVDSAMLACARKLGRDMYRDGSGKLGAIAASGSVTLASTALVLSNAADVLNFQVGQKIVFAASTTASLRSSTPRTITAIDEDTGTMTLDANINAAATAITYGDAIFTYGEYASASDRNKIMGLSGWVPSSVATNDSFFGVNRSTHPTKLAGHRLTGTSLQLDQAIYKAAVRCARSGTSPNVALLSMDNYEVLQSILMSKCTFDTISNGTYAFDVIKIMGPAGAIKVIPDYNCPPDVVFVGELETLLLKTLNAAPHILGLEGDGLRLLRSSTADSYELRVGWYGNMICFKPYAWCRISVTAPT